MRLRVNHFTGDKLQLRLNFIQNVAFQSLYCFHLYLRSSLR